MNLEVFLQARFHFFCTSHWKRLPIDSLLQLPETGHINGPFTPYHGYLYSPHFSLYISYSADRENLFDDQELPKLVIISFILMTFTFDVG